MLLRAVDRPVQVRDDPAGQRPVNSERIADRVDDLADQDLARIAELDRKEVLRRGVDLQKGDVGVRVFSDNSRWERFAVKEGDRNRIGPVDNVEICQDHTVFRQDDPASAPFPVEFRKGIRPLADHLGIDIDDTPVPHLVNQDPDLLFRKNLVGPLTNNRVFVLGQRHFMERFPFTAEFRQDGMAPIDPDFAGDRVLLGGKRESRGGRAEDQKRGDRKKTPEKGFVINHRLLLDWTCRPPKERRAVSRL